MPDAAEIEFLRRMLVNPGLMAPARLDAWRAGWRGEGSFFAHLVERGALARVDAATLGAVFKGYVKLPPASLLRLFKLEVPGAVAEPERATTAEPAVKSARSSSPSLLTAAIDAALSGLPMEEAASGNMSRGTGRGRT